MENCLVTSLKAVVADSEKKMEYADSIIIGAYVGTANTAVNLVGFNGEINSKVNLKVADNDALLKDAYGAFVNSLAVTIDNVSGNVLQGKAANTGKIRLRLLNTSDRADITTISNIYEADINKLFMYYPNLNRVTATTSPNTAKISFVSTADICSKFVNFEIASGYTPSLCTIDLGHFANATNLKTLIANGNNNTVTGSIVSFAKSTSATSINVYNRTVSGEVNDLAAAQVTNGRTSGTLALTCGGANSTVTLSGTKVSYGVNIHFDSSATGGYTTELF